MYDEEMLCEVVDLSKALFDEQGLTTKQQGQYV